MSLTAIRLASSPEAGEAVPVLNHSFTLSPHEAARIWADGEPLPADPSSGGYQPLPSRTLRSADGNWVIRRQGFTLPKDEFSQHDIAAQARAEFDRLAEFGINAISRAITVSPEGETIFTVSPWLTDLTLCDQETYSKVIAPKVTEYFQRPVGALVLYDINRSSQYSFLPGAAGQPFLHDVDPQLDVV